MSRMMIDLHTIPVFRRAVLKTITLHSNQDLVEIDIVNNQTYTQEEYEQAKSITRKSVPSFYNIKLNILKLSPDCEMVRQKILEYIRKAYVSVSAFIEDQDVSVVKNGEKFYYTIVSFRAEAMGESLLKGINFYLAQFFCEEMEGNCVSKVVKLEEIEIEEDEPEVVDAEVPLRYFEIHDFKSIEGTEIPDKAIYISDLNFESEKVFVCGEIQFLDLRTYKNKKGIEKEYYNITINDQTASIRATYFTRQRSIEKIKELKVGDFIVATGKTEFYNGNLRFTANTIDYGKMPENFVPDKKQSKPVPASYITVKPQPYVGYEQYDMFADTSIPDCLKGKSLVVFDLETTGLNFQPSAGNVDQIIEIGAYKIIDGVIKESFTTFVNPERKLPAEIVALTGISDDMLIGAPTYEKVMPDFFKFCDGCILVGHNIAGFDFKFVEYYSAKLGYMLERKLFDTIPLSQELLRLSNYKLNTIADYFGISFNHHRAIDDALVTSKIFIELIKLKKSLPNLR